MINGDDPAPGRKRQDRRKMVTAAALPETFDPHLFGMALARYRKAAGLSQDDVAQAVGTWKGNLSKIEHGKTAGPAFDLIARLAAVYGVPLDLLAAEAGLPGSYYRVGDSREAEPITDPRLVSALNYLLASPNAEWRNHVIDTLVALVNAYAAMSAPEPDEDDE